ncbi:hypothetical protein [Kangiella taiwanensis]|uniref:Uncharacterized protein n=1 Tax=Kangiella taiwanensis TaxID=1079179 RepID=A0ABP8HVL1_9GAMM|nr:hypothetical protein [Kangiella taiwanensis]
MRVAKIIFFVGLMVIASAVSAETKKYMFDIKLFEIADVSNGVQNYQELKPFTNPKMISEENKPTRMKVSGDIQKDLNFELELLAKSNRSFDINFELFKSGESVSGPIKTESYSSDKTWLMVTKFDGKSLLVTVDMEELLNQK